MVQEFAILNAVLGRGVPCYNEHLLGGNECVPGFLSALTQCLNKLNKEQGSLEQLPSLQTEHFNMPMAIPLCVCCWAEDWYFCSSEGNSLRECVDANHLCLNPHKCKCMLVSHKRRINASPLTLYLENETLEQVKMFKYLKIVYIQTFHGCLIQRRSAQKQEYLLDFYTGNYTIM